MPDARPAALVWLAIAAAAAAAGAEVRLATCDADPRLCPEATGLIHPHAPEDGTHDTFSGGVSVGDFNRDGWQDLFVVTGGEGPDRLYLNRGDGTFREAAERAGVAAVHRGHGSVVGDVDKRRLAGHLRYQLTGRPTGQCHGGTPPAVAQPWQPAGRRAGRRHAAVPQHRAAGPGCHHLTRAAVRDGGRVRRLRPRRRPGPGRGVAWLRDAGGQRAAEQPGHRRVDRACRAS